jgi:hypothetical protein
MTQSLVVHFEEVAQSRTWHPFVLFRLLNFMPDLKFIEKKTKGQLTKGNKTKTVIAESNDLWQLIDFILDVKIWFYI